MDSIYLIGSLRNEQVPLLANRIRGAMPSLEVFDDWYSPGPRADDHWKEYEIGKGHTYAQALQGWAARHVFEFDKFHLDRCDGALLLLPAGKSCHLEAGYVAGRGKPLFVLMDDPERFDVMYQFATGVAFSEEELIGMLSEGDNQRKKTYRIPPIERVDWKKGSNEPKEMGPPFPQFGPTGQYLGEGPEHEVRGSDSEPSENSAGDGVQWVPEGASRRQAHAGGQGDEAKQDDTRGDERYPKREQFCPGGYSVCRALPTVR